MLLCVGGLCLGREGTIGCTVGKEAKLKQAENLFDEIGNAVGWGTLEGRSLLIFFSLFLFFIFLFFYLVILFFLLLL